MNDASSRGPDRADLAEVIELRTRLPRQVVPDEPVRGRDSDSATDDATSVSVGPPVSSETPVGSESVMSAEPSAAADDAVRLLARRARSSGELRRELLALGHDPSEVEAVILDCESSLYLDDLGLARVMAESLRQRKRASRSQIRSKLRERLLPVGVIEEALGELDDEEEHELLRAAANDRARKMSGLDRQTAERRLLGFLARRGWSGERAVRVAREALDSTAARGAVRFR